MTSNEERVTLITPEELNTKGTAVAQEEEYLRLAQQRGLISEDGNYILLRRGPLGLTGLRFFFTSEEAADNYFDLFLKNKSDDRFLFCMITKKLHMQEVEDPALAAPSDLLRRTGGFYIAP